uniref:Sulfotransferase domain-containing protein n=1 Tax=Attheya septentrionalis TaxID=420275 RepID=A0A6T7K8R2_9STRA|mmetsp:Transcript_9765/g.17754  ORF Transcript_9765/g.17754 Transcript_9765/m.17754 type:complete len:405 (+) Transcript_9765:119-1333(+)|eukprot:CAMPEP_0198283512 /NCGR_PEP_ID=MMETSP1449-20131203/3088_1 /TAXON_ID=420275 /ORGANISM="Attheya septentrionalis, Strain CCMP2084" /LENGTH=404 /DNA_ID=CAMNT_0043980143 /DNA_START=264 /DNA_END=1478 /DNA_ORIENTATION=-
MVLAKRKGKNKPEKTEAVVKKDPAERRSKKDKPGERVVGLFETFVNHPVTIVTALVVGPYALYLLFHLLTLQHPEWLTGIIDLRPAVSVQDQRQVLVVGTMSSGTVQVASDFKELGLEVGHENSDTAWSFVRDGTISWFHGVRFLPPPTSNSIAGVCMAFPGNIGFHPVMYRPPQNDCSYRQKWSNCWMRECFQIVSKEWGCAARGDCEINFYKTLHQVRNPMRTIESLVTKFCHGEGLGVEGDVQNIFLRFSNALFPEHNFTSDTCIEAAGEFVVEYSSAMIAARERGEIDGFYKIEESSICEVAGMAGLSDPKTTVYPPNYEKVKEACDADDIYGNDNVMTVIEQTENRINLDLVSLTWEDLKGGMHGSQRKQGDASLEKAVRKLFKEFGYDPSKEDTAAKS